jgi:hypothetical protein
MMTSGGISINIINYKVPSLKYCHKLFVSAHKLSSKPPHPIHYHDLTKEITRTRSIMRSDIIYQSKSHNPKKGLHYLKFGI